MRQRLQTNPPMPMDFVPTKRRHPVGRWLGRLLAIVLIALLAFGGLIGWRLHQTATQFGSRDGRFWPAALAESAGRTNILLAGYSKDDAGHDGADLTDSIMILSLDASAKRADIISVPRDLYVQVPGHGYSKINAVYQDGQADHFSEAGYADGGMGLLEKVLARDLGVSLNYYALINYTAFRDTVNAVGGVSYTVASQDKRGLYDPNVGLRLPNGPVELNGEQALALARARGDGVGSYGFVRADFDRTEHQRQLLVAVKQAATSAGVLANPLKLDRLVRALSQNIDSNMNLGQLESLFLDIRGIDDGRIVSHGLNDYDGRDLLTGYQTSDGQSALVPAAGPRDYSVIQSKIEQTLSEN